nr:MAG TPA: hypothetical protein [Caudoviricetes sp.]
MKNNNKLSNNNKSPTTHFRYPINIITLPPTKRHTTHYSSPYSYIKLQVNIYNTLYQYLCNIPIGKIQFI